MFFGGTDLAAGKGVPELAESRRGGFVVSGFGSECEEALDFFFQRLHGCGQYIPPKPVRERSELHHKMVMENLDIQILLGRTMVLVAHPDDECVLCGGILQKMRDPVVVYATDGAHRRIRIFGGHTGAGMPIRG